VSIRVHPRFPTASFRLGDNVECLVHAFYRPADALAALPELKPSVIVTDYYILEINGLDFIRQATALRPVTAFVLITGQL